MSKFEEKLSTYTDALSKMGKTVNADLLRAVTKACGPSIYNNDSETVSSSSDSELETVKKNFLIKKLGLNDGPELDSAIAGVVEDFGKSNRNKYRAIFYYLLVIHFNKEGDFV